MSAFGNNFAASYTNALSGAAVCGAINDGLETGANAVLYGMDIAENLVVDGMDVINDGMH